MRRVWHPNYTREEYYGPTSIWPIEYVTVDGVIGVLVQHKRCSGQFTVFNDKPEVCKDCGKELVMFVGGEF